MQRPSAMLAIACVAFCTHAAAQSLSADDIEQAIQAGQKGTHERLIAKCQAVIGFREAFRAETVGVDYSGSYEVSLSQTTGQIALLSAAARRFYKPFTREQVPERLKAVGVVMTAEPSQPYESSTTRGSISVAASNLSRNRWPSCSNSSPRTCTCRRSFEPRACLDS